MTTPQLPTRRIRALIATLILSSCAASASGDATIDTPAEVRAWRQANERAILDEFTGLLAIPNVATDRDDIRRNAKVLVEVRGNDITAEQSAASPMEALDLIVEKVEQRLRRRKTAKLARRTRAGKPLEPAAV